MTESTYEEIEQETEVSFSERQRIEEILRKDTQGRKDAERQKQQTADILKICPETLKNAKSTVKAGDQYFEEMEKLQHRLALNA